MRCSVVNVVICPIHEENKLVDLLYIFCSVSSFFYKANTKYKIFFSDKQHSHEFMTWATSMCSPKT